MKSPKKTYRKILKNPSTRTALLSGLALIVVGMIWSILSVSIRADTVGTVSFQAESGTKTGSVTTIADVAAAGGSAVKFGAASTGDFKANCIVKPSDCGYPDATNTGVKDGITLVNSGSVTVTQNGAIVQNLRITDGQIVVKANNVTIRNVLISGCTYYPVDYDNGTYSGLVVEDTEINSTCAATTAGLSFGGYTARRVDVHGTADGFKADSNAVIEDSYIHGLAVTAESHNDGLQSMGGNNVTFRRNTCDTNTAGVCIQFGSFASGWLVTDNLVRATGWAFNGGTNMSGNTFTNNRFARAAGWYGAASIEGSNTWSGNYYDDTGATVNL